MDSVHNRIEAAERRRRRRWRRTWSAHERAMNPPRSVLDLDPDLLEAAAFHLTDFIHDYVCHKDGSWNGHSEEIAAHAAAYLELCRAARFVRAAHAARGPTPQDVRRARQFVRRAERVKAGRVPAEPGFPQCTVCGGAIKLGGARATHPECVKQLAKAVRTVAGATKRAEAAE